jgi:phospholipid transport system substrate-binding protein
MRSQPVVRRLGLVILALVFALSFGTRRFGDNTPTSDAAALAAAPATSPLDIVRSSVSRGLGALGSPRTRVRASEGRRAEIRRAARDLFDVNDMARRALGQHWQGLPPLEQEEFVRLFTGVLRQSFVAVIERHTDGDLASMYEEVAGAYARVRSRGTRVPGSESRIEYRLFASGPRWAVYDIVLDGASLVADLRAQFHAIIVTSPSLQLLERMRTEASGHARARAAIPDARADELEASARERLATGLLLGAASRARGR